MTKKELFEKYYDMACHNLLCYSENYGMTRARKGMENKWLDTSEEVRILKELIGDEELYEKENGNDTSDITVDSISVSKGKPFSIQADTFTTGIGPATINILREVR